MELKSQINVEVLIKSDFFVSKNTQLRNSIFEWLVKDLKQTRLYLKSTRDHEHFIITNFPNTQIKNINLNFSNNPDIEKFINGVGTPKVDMETHTLDNIRFVFYFYKLYDDVMQQNLEEDLPCTFHTLLPSKDLVGLWESLFFDNDLKSKLLNYVHTSILFGKRNVNTSLVNWNKVLLLHGPPGTGKTSLCKALCQKLSIILNDQYGNFQLIEINSHSLFSKWFSESGKLILKLFDNIREFAQDSSNMIFVLIDEVESLVYDRQRINSADPTDAIRVVNAILTQLDSIKRYPNVIILANSNITKAMDNAFIDRADIKQFIGYPSTQEIYGIYRSSIQELIDSQMIIVNDKNRNNSFCHWNQLKFPKPSSLSNEMENSYQLFVIAEISQNLAGRTLRKLPFLAYALHCYGEDSVPLSKYLEALNITVRKHIDDNKYFNNH